ncbi:MAG TPA: type II toxin-antitoxin system prevent-host-death family antitoxin [Kiritimatiellia bacterium]|jgi:prevent-host-death family protein|nr:type II toxin-antitoxin system prevent-host-death family antitoxin [Kiritimatiellia bacterium]
MITTLREGKARLSALVEMAARGEDVVITVHGKPKVRLQAISPRRHELDSRQSWLRELKKLRAQHTRISSRPDSAALDAVREERA